MALAGGPEELGTAAWPSSARTCRPPMRTGNPDRSSGISARPIHELDPDMPGPAGPDGTTGGNAIGAADVELYGDSDCGEEIDLELPVLAGARGGSGSQSG
jgi:hypothetical protein